MPIERSKRNRENASESETQGRRDTVKHFNQEHTTKKKNKGPRDKCEMENKNIEKIILETILERETKEKEKEDTSVSAQYQNMEVVCKQEIINEEYIHFATWLATNVYHFQQQSHTTTYILFNWKIAKCQ